MDEDREGQRLEMGQIPLDQWQFKPSAPAKLSKPAGAPIGPKHRCWEGKGFEKEKKKSDRRKKVRRRETGDDMVLLGTWTQPSTSPPVDPIILQCSKLN